MDNYIFIYKDLLGSLHTATNPKFIAKHQMCRAIPKDIIASYTDSISDLLYTINYGDELPKNAVDLIHKSELVDLIPQYFLNNFEEM